MKDKNRKEEEREGGRREGGKEKLKTQAMNHVKDLSAKQIQLSARRIILQQNTLQTPYHENVYLTKRKKVPKRIL